jgi:hypothetical protein
VDGEALRKANSTILEFSEGNHAQLLWLICAETLTLQYDPSLLIALPAAVFQLRL